MNRYSSTISGTVLVMSMATILPRLAIASETAPVDPSPTNYVVITDNVPFKTEVVIQAPGGKLAWRDLFLGLARAHHFDDQELTGASPSTSCDLGTPCSQWALYCLNRMGGSSYSFRVHSTSGGEHQQLVIHIDNEAFLESRRAVKDKLRHWMRAINGGVDRHQVGLKMVEGWQNTDPTLPLVVLVHGYNARSSELVALVEAARERGYPVGTFDYPNDQSIQDSADLLAGELKAVARQHPDRQVALVTHSMGGVLARAVIEDAAADPGNVAQLIMVSPPNHGSTLAYFARGLDVWECFCRRPVTDWEFASLTAAIHDGLAEANTDLCPDSIFLARLNRRDRNPRVAYAILLGNRAWIAPERYAELLDRVDQAAESNRFLSFVTSRITARLADLDEVVHGAGDGVVALKRGMLEGVEDVAILEMDHNAMLRSPAEDATAVVHEEIFSRLTR